MFIRPFPGVKIKIILLPETKFSSLFTPLQFTFIRADNNPTRAVGTFNYESLRQLVEFNILNPIVNSVLLVQGIFQAPFLYKLPDLIFINQPGQVILAII